MQNQTRRNMLLDLLKKEPDDVFLNVLLLKPEYLPCYYQIGQLKEKLNDTNSAIEFYKKGIALAKLQNNTKAMGELNEALWMLDDE
jgi:hypothetical protein